MSPCASRSAKCFHDWKSVRDASRAGAPGRPGSRGVLPRSPWHRPRPTRRRCRSSSSGAPVRARGGWGGGGGTATVRGGAAQRQLRRTNSGCWRDSGAPNQPRWMGPKARAGSEEGGAGVLGLRGTAREPSVPGRGRSRVPGREGPSPGREEPSPRAGGAESLGGRGRGDRRGSGEQQRSPSPWGIGRGPRWISTGRPARAPDRDCEWPRGAAHLPGGPLRAAGRTNVSRATSGRPVWTSGHQAASAPARKGRSAVPRPPGQERRPCTPPRDRPLTRSGRPESSRATGVFRTTRRRAPDLVRRQWPDEALGAGADSRRSASAAAARASLRRPARS